MNSQKLNIEEEGKIKKMMFKISQKNELSNEHINSLNNLNNFNFFHVLIPFIINLGLIIIT